MSQHKSSVHRHPRERGQSAAEFAIVLPIMCLLLVSIFEFGQLIAVRMELTSATRDGARRAAVARHEEDPEAVVIQVTESSLDLIDPADIDIDVDGGWDQDDDVVVSATTPHELNVMGLHIWSGNLRSESTVRIG